MSTPSRQRFQNILTARLTLSPGRVGEIITKKAGSVALRLYELTAKIAPTKEKIKADVKRRGWQVKRPKGAWPRKPGEPKGSPGPLNRMRAGVIERRLKARGSVAVGWLPAVNQLRGAGSSRKKTLVPVKNPRGTVTIARTSHSTFTVTIANQMPGVAKVEARYDLVRKALNAESADMIAYIRQKLTTGSGRGVGGRR